MTLLAMNKIKKYSLTEPKAGKPMSSEERERLIIEYAPLVKVIAGRLALKLPRHISQEDLVSSGIMGLLDAINKFDASKGVKLKSYAEFRIRGAMIDELRAMDWVPRAVRKSARMVEKAYMDVENREMRPASDEEVARELGMKMEEFHKLLEYVKGVSIINEYEFALRSHRANVIDPGYVGPNVSETPLESLDKTEIRDVIAKGLDRLPQNERKIMSLYYYEELTMKEIGQIMGFTESRVSQLHTKAVMRLRGKLKGYFE